MEAERQAVRHGVAATADEMNSTDWILRDARLEDAAGIASVLAEAFPGLYHGTFGRLSRKEIVNLIAALYHAGHLSLDATRLCAAGESVAGIMILHTGLPVGRGTAMDYWRLLCHRYGIVRALRPFFGGVLANLMLDRRIPRAPDLVYIEALAVTESARGQGFGTRLLADAEQWARDQGRSRLALHVLVSNNGARRLYEQTGFRPWQPPSTRSSQNPLRFRSSSSWSAILMVRALE